jgi:hypothetical protein
MDIVPKYNKLHKVGSFQGDPTKTATDSSKTKKFSPMRTGVSEFMESKKAKGYEFAKKPNHVNPFKTYDSLRSSDQDTAPSPTKKDTIIRRHADNYGTKFVVGDDFKTQLTPCRWNKSGWKYGAQQEAYFGSDNKMLNSMGHIGKHKVGEVPTDKGYFKTSYMKGFKNKIEKNNESKF